MIDGVSLSFLKIVISKQMKSFIPYLFKVWITTAVLSPLLILVYGLVIEKETAFFDLLTIKIDFFMIMAGLILSLPSFIVLYVCCNLLILWIPKIYLVKIILCILSILFVTISFAILDLEGSAGKILLPVIYDIVIVSSIWLYRFYSKEIG
jgi:hypothetical protein